MNHTIPITPTGTMALVTGTRPGATTGGDRPLCGGDRPLSGGQTPLCGGDCPLCGGWAPLIGADHPPDDGRTSLPGTFCSLTEKATFRRVIKELFSPSHKEILVIIREYHLEEVLFSRFCES